MARDPVSEHCLGSYMDDEDCYRCRLETWCIDATIRNDGYYDSMADREEEIACMEADALFQAAAM